MSEYRDVPGYEGHYQVSRHGLIRSLKRSVKIMCPSVTRTGYWQINLYLSGKVKHYYIHRLVAEAFIGPIAEGLEVNHKDGNKANNDVSNLEIVTAKENINHAIALGLKPPVRGEGSPRAKLKDGQVREIRRLKGTLRVKEIAGRFGVSERTIYCILSGATWRHVA